VLNQPFPACALIGAQNPEELSSCDEGSRIKLTREELDWLDLTRETMKA
jgi:aryl-alcohol dehydrogenase-like predicted oxidoreductase